VIVPLAAVQFAEGGGRGVVMVAGDQGVAIRREVETGEVFDGKVQIRGGVNPGEPVIVQGAYGLADGTKIRLRQESKP
jgi:multidrug efflux pump subunit AcrA (membrane-fusion protein)